MSRSAVIDGQSGNPDSTLAGSSRRIPMNPAEAMIEPFFDSRLSRLSEWQIQPVDAIGVRVWQPWGWVAFEWVEGRTGQAAFSMSRQFDLECPRDDTLVVCVRLPEGATIQVDVETDIGVKSATSGPAGPLKIEHVVPLEDATWIGNVSLTIVAGSSGAFSGFLTWIALRESKMLDRYLEQWRGYDARWEHYLKPEEHDPSFEPSLGLLFDSGTLEGMRDRHERHVRQFGTSPVIERAHAALNQVPEDLIDERVNFWDDTRFCREWKHGKIILDHGLNAAFAGVLTRDKEMLLLAARYAMSITMCDRWSDGPVSELPGSNFEQRGFIHSLCMYELSLILDLAGDVFTDLGRDYILRKMAEQGEGAINYATWRWDYLWEGNQLAWITPGRVYAYLAIEREMPRAKPYTDLAIDDLRQNLERALLSDGGYPEGPMYFAYVVKSAAQALFAYSKVRGIPIRDLLPEKLLRTSVFGEITASTDQDRELVPTADCLQRFYRELDGLALLAWLMPDSQWPGIYRKTLRLQSNGLPWSILAMAIDAEIPETSPPLQSWTLLPETGSLSSVRYLDGESVRLLVPGIVGGVDHHHEDGGNFVLEVAGETFAFDPGSTDYSDPLSFQFKWAQRHNMLTPIAARERPKPVGPPIPEDVKAIGHGDETSLNVSVDNAIAGWDEWFTRKDRRITSDHPSRMTFHDSWQLKRGDGVAFHWQTLLPVSRVENDIVVTGKRATLFIGIPDRTEVIVDDLPWLKDQPQHRIRFIRKEMTGTMDVTVRIVVHD